MVKINFVQKSDSVISFKIIYHPCTFLDLPFNSVVNAGFFGKAEVALIVDAIYRFTSTRISFTMIYRYS